jgi:hypothetical protein
MKINCKKCGCEIFAEYSPIESLNSKKGRKKIFSELKTSPTEICNTSIYLTCENDHVEKYFCKIEELNAIC